MLRSIRGPRPQPASWVSLSEKNKARIERVKRGVVVTKHFCGIGAAIAYFRMAPRLPTKPTFLAAQKVLHIHPNLLAMVDNGQIQHLSTEQKVDIASRYLLGCIRLIDCRDNTIDTDFEPGNLVRQLLNSTIGTEKIVTTLNDQFGLTTSQERTGIANLGLAHIEEIEKRLREQTKEHDDNVAMCNMAIEQKTKFLELLQSLVEKGRGHLSFKPPHTPTDPANNRLIEIELAQILAETNAANVNTAIGELDRSIRNLQLQLKLANLLDKHASSMPIYLKQKIEEQELLVFRETRDKIIRCRRDAHKDLNSKLSDSAMSDLKKRLQDWKSGD